jgi:predicted acetyltransferase
MARTIGKDLLEEKIEKAQEDVVRAKKKYDVATATLKQLLDKRQAMRIKEVMAAIAKSNRSYEDIMNYINIDDNAEPEEE